MHYFYLNVRLQTLRKCGESEGEVRLSWISRPYGASPKKSHLSLQE